jgi:hypothetical protein
MQRAAIDVDFSCRGGHVGVCRCERLGNQFLYRLGERAPRG